MLTHGGGLNTEESWRFLIVIPGGMNLTFLYGLLVNVGPVA